MEFEERLEEIVKKLSVIEEGFTYCDYPNTIVHQTRVAEIALLIGKELRLSKKELFWLYINARFHDFAKKDWPDVMAWLKRDDEAYNDEHEELRLQHPSDSYSLLLDKTQTKVDAGHNIFRLLCDKKRLMPVRSHQERYDGISILTDPEEPYNGYPGELSGENIPLLARIIRVADTYDAMRSKREYRSVEKRGKSHKDTMETIVDISCNEVGPTVASAFKRIESEILEKIYETLPDVVGEYKRT